MKTLKYILLSLAALSVVFACTDEPNGYTVDTKSFCIEAFGPNPVVRGESLTFVGQHLDQVTSIVLPIAEEVVAADFTTHTANQIVLTVPIDCEAGYVTVNYSSKSITLETALSFSETFEIWSVGPQDSSKELLEAGDSVVVSGEYLNNVCLVGFLNGITVDEEEFGTRDRNTIVFALPAGAISGLIYCEDGNGYQVYSTDELSVLQPVISAVSPLEVSPYELVTITGSRLDQVVTVTFTGCSAIDAADFVSQSYDTIEVYAPYNIADGAVTIETAAGQTVTSDDELTVALPSELSIAPAKDYYRGGWNALISGERIDLVSGVYFFDENGDQSWAACWYDEDLEAVVATIPENAVNGSVYVYLANGTVLYVDEIELTLPTIESISPSEVVAGETITLTGTDLDLVSSAAISGVACTIVGYGKDGVSVSIQTNDLCPNAAVTVTLANGTSVTSEDVVTFSYNTTTQCTSYAATISNTIARTNKSTGVVNEDTSVVYYGEVLNIYGSGFSAIETIYLDDLKITSYVSRSDSQLSFVVPEDIASGVYNPIFTLADGTVEYCPLQVDIHGYGTTIVLWSGEYSFGTSWGGFSNLSWDLSPFIDEPIPYDMGAAIIIEFYMESYAEYLLACICTPADWSILNSCYDSEYAQADGWSVGSDVTKITYYLRDEDIDTLNTYGVLIRGYNMALTKVSLHYDD